MKAFRILLGFVGCSAIAAQFTQAQVQNATNAAPIIPGQYFVADQGPHHRIWQSITLRTNRLGGVSYQTNSYTELETGMAHLVAGQWVPSSDDIQITANGAAATNAAHQAAFASDASAIGAINLTTPDGKTLSSRVLGLSYLDPATGSNAMIAEIRSSVGLLLPPNQVLYTNALGGDCGGDLLYVFSKAGLEQNFILRVRPPAPAEYGLSSSGIMLQLWTEFFSPPAPDFTTTGVPSDSGGSAIDSQLGFGAMQIGPGRAFMLGDDDAFQGVRVLKEWVTISNRTFLVEEVPLDQIAEQLSSLPPVSPGKQGAMLRPGGTNFIWQTAHQARASSDLGSMHLAKLDFREKPGLVWDYSILASQTNAVFNSDSTTYVSGTVNLSGSNVFFGGAIIKYTNNASINLSAGTNTPTIRFATSAYRPVIFTSKDDNSVGETISGSTGTPSNYVANAAISCNSLSPPPLGNSVMKFCKTALSLTSTPLVLTNSQFVNCQVGIQGSSCTVNVRNALFANVLTNLVLVTSNVVTVENATFSSSSYFAAGSPSPAGCSLAVTNSVLANMTNLTASSLSLTGAFNGFYASATYGASPISLSAYPFQSAAAGYYYLCDQSIARNAGTTQIDAGLLAGLQTMTTYPPIVYTNVLSSNDTTFWPQASRDTDQPDLGYHYWPLDYVCQILRMTSATLTVMPGTAIGTGGSHIGIGLLLGAHYNSIGSPTQPNWIARINMVQECQDSSWNGMNDSLIGDYVNESFTATATLRFNNFSMPAQDVGAINNNFPASFSLTDCQFFGGKFSILNPNLYVTNCLFDRVNSYIDDSSIGINVSPIVRNCLFHAGILTVNHWNGDTWIFSDNAFDQVAITQSGNVQGAQNGYTTGTTRLSSTNAYDVVTNITWYVGPLGAYYQATNSGFIDKGSTNANYVELYHYTVTTNLVGGLEIKEANTPVDLGFHYVAVDSNGNPIDTDGDGIPDFLEDANGNGKVDSGETDWQSATDLGLKVIITRPSTGSGVP